LSDKTLFPSVDPESIPFSRTGNFVSYLSSARTLLLFRDDFQSRVRVHCTALQDGLAGRLSFRKLWHPGTVLAIYC